MAGLKVLGGNTDDRGEYSGLGQQKEHQPIANSKEEEQDNRAPKGTNYHRSKLRRVSENKSLEAWEDLGIQKEKRTKLGSSRRLRNSKKKRIPRAESGKVGELGIS